MRTELENSLTAQKSTIDELNHRLSLTNISLRNMQDERNAAVNSAAAAIAAQKHLIDETEALREDIDALSNDKADLLERLDSEADASKAKEAVLRKRIDRAREGEALAREVVEALQKRLEGKGKAPDVAGTRVIDGIACTVEIQP